MSTEISKTFQLLMLDKNKIRKLITRRGINVTEMCLKHQVSRQVFYGWISGKVRMPKQDTAIKIYDMIMDEGLYD